MENAKTHPPLKAPTGFRTGMAPVVTSSNLLLDWKVLVWRSAGVVVERRVRATAAEDMRAAIFVVFAGRCVVEFVRSEGDDVSSLMGWLAVD